MIYISFYDKFSTYYDDIFPLNKEKLEFLSNIFSRNNAFRILDIGTGTGSYAVELARRGFKLTGIDLDFSMIKIAEGKVENGLDVNFEIIDMLRIDEFFENDFDGIYIIGNVLVHLASREEIKKFLKKTLDIMQDNGVLIIQIINYDRIIDQKVGGLSTIVNEDKGVSFERNYKLYNNGKKINFNTVLKIKDNDKQDTYENNVSLIPLRSAELVSFLKDAGYKNIDLYGNLNGKPFEVDSSIPCIAVASL
ncbi:MAG: class I SAM-dependent methyltransferase [Bacillota bacterium]